MKKYLEPDSTGWWRSASNKLHSLVVSRVNHTSEQAGSTVSAFSNPVVWGHATTYQEMMPHSPWHQSPGCAPQGKSGLQRCLLEPALVSLGQVATALRPACYPPLTFGRLTWFWMSASPPRVAVDTHLRCVSQNVTYLLPGTFQASSNSKLCQRSFRCDQTEAINRSEPTSRMNQHQRLCQKNPKKTDCINTR